MSVLRRFLLLLVVLLAAPMAAAQQQYEANAQDDCDTDNGSSVLGYTCATASPPCTAYLTFRSAPPSYASPITVSYLLNASVPAVAAANAVPVAPPVARDGLLLVPVPCACTAAGYYQHDAGYVIQFDDETYFIMANDTYQGLTTCQALMAQNPAHDSLNLYPGIKLNVPLRCACPSPAQAAAGVKYLVTYLLGWEDDSSTVADRFGADYQAVLFANNLTDDSTVYPFTTMLVPLKHRPKADVTVLPLPEPPSPSPAPAVSAPPPPAVHSSESGSGRWKESFRGRCIGIGVGVGFAVLASGALLALFLLWRRWRWQRNGELPRTAILDMPLATGKEGAKATPTTLVDVDVRDAVGSLTVYEYAELERATARFAQEQRIGNSSVYRAVINGNAAAVKRVAGDVGIGEVSVLGRVNHSCLVRLFGLCVHHGDTYLVFELAENGALSDWIHAGGGDNGGRALAWRQRMQVAFDVADGLNYLHNYTSPPYVHKNLKSSNVLLDADFRAKVSNFGLARAVVISGARAGAGAQMTSRVVGTQGYLAPEYLEHGLIGPHLDVFAFGVVLLELLSGKEAAPARDGGDGGEALALLLWEEAEGQLLVDGDDARDKVAAFMDSRLRGDYPSEVALAMTALALRCIAREPRARPSMAEVFLSLSKSHSSTLDLPPMELSVPAATLG
uniref:Protein kinase domain-containing protein n=1 Tax=Oryza punctata TaxID=4537 RepID=A0A0E0LDN7_ORYPU